MPLIKGIRNLVITEPQRRRNNLFFFFLLVALSLVSCTREKILIGASWDGDSDFMVITEQKMKMNKGIKFKTNKSSSVKRKSFGATSRLLIGGSPPPLCGCC